MIGDVDQPASQPANKQRTGEQASTGEAARRPLNFFSQRPATSTEALIQLWKLEHQRQVTTKIDKNATTRQDKTVHMNRSIRDETKFDNNNHVYVCRSSVVAFQ